MGSDDFMNIKNTAEHIKLGMKHRVFFIAKERGVLKRLLHVDFFICFCFHFVLHPMLNSYS